MKKQFQHLMLAAMLLVSNWSFAQCDAPANLSFNLSNNVSTFTWDPVPGAIDYTIEMKYDVYTWQNPELVMNVSTNSLSFTGIMQSISLDWRVKANCSSGGSAYTESTFSIPCPLPTALNATNITETSATINWTPAAGYNTLTSDFVAAYRIANSGSNWTFLGHTFGSLFNISGLTPGVTYEYCVNQTCAYSNSDPAFGQFTTLIPSCATPSNLTISNVLNTTATVSWNAVAGGNSYDLRYKALTSSVWTPVVNVTSTSRNLTYLAQNTDYEIQVRTHCSGSYSAYSNSVYFSTENCVSSGNNNSEWIDRFKVGSINRYSVAEIGGYVNTGLSTNLTIGSRKNSGTISAGYSGSVRAQNFCVYIDFNRNGRYDDAGERVFGSGYINTSGNVNFKFDIPNTATNGPAGMRVIMAKNGSGTIYGCLNGFLGETEDYTVNLVGGSNKPSAIEDETSEEVVIYPNPSKGKYTITFPQDNKPQAYQILTLNGKVIASQTNENDFELSVDISNQLNGIYLLKLIDDSGITTYHKLQKF